jgi:hypothetical protein
MVANNYRRVVKQKNMFYGSRGGLNQDCAGESHQQLTRQTIIRDKETNKQATNIVIEWKVQQDATI